MDEHPYGWLSLTPPLVAIALAIITRRIVLSLVLGIFAGALLMADGNVLTAIYQTWEVHLWNTLIDPGKLRVFSFTLLMGSLVGVISSSGGMRGLIELVAPWARTRRRGQVTTYVLGLVIFFDDYANTILLGHTLRPVYDRLRISREKLAYIVDSTAAPIAGLALVSTWIAVELDYLASGLAATDELGGVTAFELFIATIPYRFYVWGALVFVAAVAVTGRDFGPMRTAEQRSQEFGLSEQQELSATDEPVERVAGWYHAVIPLAVTVLLVIYFLYATGYDAVQSSMVDGESSGEISLRDIIGAADSTIALQYGALVGLIVAMVMGWTARLMSWSDLLEAAGHGAQLVLPAIAILWTAAAMSRMTTDQSVDGTEASTRYEFQDHRLYTADYLGQVLGGNSSASPHNSFDPTETDPTIEPSREQPANAPGYSANWLPTIVFLIAGAVAFSTGTSWGTMGILIPMVFPLTRALTLRDGIPFDETSPILLASVGGVLAGAVFGDHCSPISDTTVLSSQASGCDHLAHVWTQLPYATAVAVVAVIFGTVPVGFGVSVWWLIPVQFVALIGVLLLLGRNDGVDGGTNESQSCGSVELPR